MRNGLIFQKSVGISVISCLLGLGACAYQADDIIPIDEDIAIEENSVQQTDLDDSFMSNDPNACSPDMEGCENSDDYLINHFSQTTDVFSDDYSDIETDDELISLSRPAGAGTVSVKEKQLTKKLGNEESLVPVNNTPAKAPEEKVLYTTVAIPEKLGTTKVTETTVDTTKITKTPAPNVVVSTPKPPVNNPSAKAPKEKVLYTTVAVPEELGTTKVTETTIDTTKVTKTPAPDMDIAVSSPNDFIPLKKTTTTITETTTKVKPEKKKVTTPDFRKMTLAEKVEYGQSEQDWEARSGTTLRGLLMDWGSKSGWTVVWKLDRDYNLEAGVTFRGTFTEVASALIRSFARATPPPIGTFHQGNRVLVINAQENENER